MSWLESLRSSVPPPGTSAHKAYLRDTGSTPEQGASAYEAQQSVPPPGTSAYKAYEYYQKNGKPAPTLTEILSGVDPVDPVNPSASPYKPSAHGLSRAKVAQVDYINAELAKHYGMNKSTAYQEALSNTSYQRAVKDMQAAGLNPSVMFGSGRAQGASSSVYASEARSGGGYSRRRGSGSSGNGKLFSSGMYYGISTAVGLATAVMTKNPANYWIGSAGAQGAMGALNAALKK